MYNRVEICGVDTSKLPVLKEKEAEELLLKIKQGDKEARNEFINANLRLVLSIVKKFKNRGENIDDIFQIGCVGLIKAIDNFDITQNVKFSTYAVPMIIGEIKRYLRDNSILRVTRTLKDLAYKALSIKENYMYKTGEEPTIEYIAEVLEVEKEEIVFALESMQDIVSIYENAYSDSESDNFCIIDQIKDTKNLEEKWSSNLAIKEGMNRLNNRERTIIEKRFFQGKTQTEVAEEIGISQAQISRLERSALKRIRKYV
ncbi:MAG: RNA polymerase sporulation sigma factor SigG [Clostridiales bacterium]|nr:RNA polymerase sporulation sigma factor SigG [Clostridiales bacterium]